MGEIIGQSTAASAGVYSTWGKLRCALIGAYDQFETDAAVQTQPHNLTIASGFHADEGLFLRVVQWPATSQWSDSSSGSHIEYNGPIVGFQNGLGVSDSFFSVGAYDWSGNDTLNPNYSSVNNNLDETDIADSLVGLTVTYSSGTFTTTSDAFENDPATFPPWYGQDIGFNAITSVTAIDTFTAF